MTQTNETVGQGGTLRISRAIRLPYWDDSVRRSLVDFWEKRGVRFARSNGDELHGRRGSLLGNYFSFDMSRLRTNVSIRREGAVAIVCDLEIDIQGQIITSWNRRYWDLELDTLESWLLFGEDRREEWEEYRRKCRRNDFLMVVWFPSGLRDIDPDKKEGKGG